MTKKHRTTVEIDRDLFEWHRANFPEGTFWLTINNLLKEFKNSFEGDKPVNFYIDYKTPAQLLKDKLSG